MPPARQSTLQRGRDRAVCSFGAPLNRAMGWDHWIGTIVTVTVTGNVAVLPLASLMVMLVVPALTEVAVHAVPRTSCLPTVTTFVEPLTAVNGPPSAVSPIVKACVRPVPRNEIEDG